MQSSTIWCHASNSGTARGVLFLALFSPTTVHSFGAPLHAASSWVSSCSCSYLHLNYGVLPAPNSTHRPYSAPALTRYCNRKADTYGIRVQWRICVILYPWTTRSPLSSTVGVYVELIDLLIMIALCRDFVQLYGSSLLLLYRVTPTMRL